MLETPLPAVTRERPKTPYSARAAAAARTAPAPLPRTAPARSPAVPRAPQPARRPVRGPEGGRLARSEARLLAVAVTCTALVCGLLVLYLAAYAHVTWLGLNQSHAASVLRHKRLENQTLKAQYAALLNPDRLAREATAQGMTRDAAPVDYIVPSPDPSAPPARVATADGDLSAAQGDAGEGPQGTTNRGTTAHHPATAYRRH